MGMLSGAKKACSVFCAIFVILSLGLHTVQIKHEHHRVDTTRSMHFDMGVTFAHAGNTQAVPASSESLADKMHMAEKKFVIFVLAAALLYTVRITQVLCYQQIAQCLCAVIKSRHRMRPSILNVYLIVLYASGILNPKLH